MIKISTNILLACAAAVLLILNAIDIVNAHPRHSIGHRIAGETQQVIKTVPEGSTLELRIRGAVAQSMSVAPGTYRITIEQMR